MAHTRRDGPGPRAAVAVETTSEPYSHGAYREHAERRLRSRASDSRQRTQLARFYEIDEPELESRLTELHRSLRQPPGIFGREMALFPTKD